MPEENSEQHPDPITHLDHRLERTNALLKKFSSHRQAFIRGIFAGLGGSLGATLVLALILWVASQLEFVPIVGSFATDVINFINQNSPIATPGH